MQQVSGTLYSYFFLCTRKLWLYHHHISFESEHSAVQLGKELDETSYQRERRQIDIDGIAKIDYIKDGVVYEVKKSDKQSQMAINQLKYYLYLLHLKGVSMTGQINYPLLKKTLKVTLSQDDIEEIENNLKSIEHEVSKNEPPSAQRKSFCKNCAYHDFCFA
ncbi:MAG: CRISPR-associated protein Cas4 [Clostridia bacterium]